MKNNIQSKIETKELSTVSFTKRYIYILVYYKEPEKQKKCTNETKSQQTAKSASEITVEMYATDHDTISIASIF
jgi:hypothetical protein